MTDKEAIKQLELIAINLTNEIGTAQSEYASKLLDAYNTAQEALKEREERQNGCAFCSTVYTKGDWAEVVPHDFRLDGCTLYYNDAHFGWEGITVNNCPMCGRNLKEG